MVQAIGNRKEKGVIRSLDYWTIIIYIALLSFGWVSVCGASYSYGDTDLFSLDTRSGMQIVWIGTSIVLGFVILMLDDRYLDMFAYIIFGVMLILLFGTIFNPHSIKGSRSWLVLGPIRLQPAEFAKFATALALAKLMNTYGFNIGKWKDFGLTLAVIFIPMLFIVMQRETGSALVYLSFFLMLYREGMSGFVLFALLCAVTYFVLVLKFAGTLIMGIPMGTFIVLTCVMIVIVIMLLVYCRSLILGRNVALGYIACALIAWGLSALGVHINGYVFFFTVIPLSLIYLLIGMFHDFTRIPDASSSYNLRHHSRYCSGNC